MVSLIFSFVISELPSSAQMAQLISAQEFISVQDVQPTSAQGAQPISVQIHSLYGRIWSCAPMHAEDEGVGVSTMRKPEHSVFVEECGMRARQ